MEDPHFDIIVESSPTRCFSDAEYMEAGITVSDDLSSCDVLLGVKEPKIEQLQENKTYFVFSHTIKAQAYNRDLLLAFLKKNIRLIDYEVLTDAKGIRLIAFGRFAGLVGAHNALWTWCEKHGISGLPRLKDLDNFLDVLPYYKAIQWPNLKILLTGKGRVANGAAETLRLAGIDQVSIDQFLDHTFNKPVYCQIGPLDYAKKTNGEPFELSDYFNYPEQFTMDFSRFYYTADLLINGIFWDPRSPAFFTANEMSSPNFNLKVIADITCDIAPDSSIPSTLRPSTIEDPVYGYHPQSHEETQPFSQSSIDVMAIDNLPNEIPRDASLSFGEQFIEHILQELTRPNSMILERAEITSNGQLGAHFAYLEDFVKGK